MVYFEFLKQFSCFLWGFFYKGFNQRLFPQKIKVGGSTPPTVFLCETKLAVEHFLVFFMDLMLDKTWCLDTWFRWSVILLMHILTIGSAIYGVVWNRNVKVTNIF